MKGKEIFILMADCDMTMHSSMEPTGFAVTSVEEAKVYLKNSSQYFNCFRKVVVLDTAEEVRAAEKAEAIRLEADFVERMKEIGCVPDGMRKIPYRSLEKIKTPSSELSKEERYLLEPLMLSMERDKKVMSDD